MFRSLADTGLDTPAPASSLCHLQAFFTESSASEALQEAFNKKDLADHRSLLSLKHLTWVTLLVSDLQRPLLRKITCFNLQGK